MESQTEIELIGEEAEDDEPFDLSSLRANEMFPIHQTLYLWDTESDDGFAKAEQVGHLNGTVMMTRGERAVCLFVFSFDDGSGLVAAGVLPLDRAWDDEHHIAVTGGIGRHARAAGTVGVLSKNPKRYNISFTTGG